MKLKLITLIAAGAICTTPVLAEDMKNLAMEGKGVIQAFGGTLKAELVSAMKSGGPTKAVIVCNVSAPEIASKVSADKGWTVARSSHKLRNPDNAPDDFTRATIEGFLAREQKGEKAVDMVKTAIVEEGGKKIFRMVKAIPTGGVCLKCHGGKSVSSETEAILKEHYPEDKARDFTAGQMRGVFTLQKVLSE
ncbi:MAG: DUF3365 domain-containing protein [Hyphomicrobiales bacterium]|nr:DUF3365 domain-containing protein [Hyphomicrobiales bacterium]